MANDLHCVTSSFTQALPDSPSLGLCRPGWRSILPWPELTPDVPGMQSPHRCAHPDPQLESAGNAGGSSCGGSSTKGTASGCSKLFGNSSLSGNLGTNTESPAAGKIWFP